VASRFGWIRRRSGWTLLGIAVGLVVAPVSALAAFSDVRVVGVFGNPPSAVTPAYQLQTAEIAPDRIRNYDVIARGSGTACSTVNMPAGNSFMIRTIQIDAYSVETPGLSDTVYVYDAPGCGGGHIASLTPLSNRENATVPLEPGVPIRAGGGFSVGVFSSDMSAEVHVTGYLMPSNAVPAGASAAAITKSVGKADSRR
jgi:hypothetical protein